MKSIYKKISVGVLAAALLVGGSGALQVGQVFADSRYIEFDNEKEKIKEAFDLDFEEYKAGKYDFSEFYDRGRNRRLSVGKALDRGLKIKEVRDNPKFNADISFEDGWEFSVRKIYDESIKLGRSQVKVKVGSLCFIAYY